MRDKYSISQVNAFKRCRRAYWFKYIEGIEPVEKAEALVTGATYHELLERLYAGEPLPEDDYSKEVAMATAYQKFILPKVPVKESEKWFEREYNGVTFFGRVDGISDTKLIEHKTTSLDIASGQYEFDLQWDEQLILYMFLTGMREAQYTVCKKPTIRQKKDEADEEFFQRMVDWYDEEKIQVLDIYRTDAEVEFGMQDLWGTVREMDTGRYYMCTSYCNAWGRRCEYSPICLCYEREKSYVGFTKK